MRTVDFRQSPERQALLAIYTEVDALLAPYSCESTTECCRFGITGREPYPTAIESRELATALARAPLPKKKTLTLADANKEGRCPLLSEDGRCRVYASRPFGCRTFFCERRTGPNKWPRADVLRLSRAVAALSERFAPQSPHPRPLRSWLLDPKFGQPQR